MSSSEEVPQPAPEVQLEARPCADVEGEVSRGAAAVQPATPSREGVGASASPDALSPSKLAGWPALSPSSASSSPPLPGLSPTSAPTPSPAALREVMYVAPPLLEAATPTGTDTLASYSIAEESALENVESMTLNLKRGVGSCSVVSSPSSRTARAAATAEEAIVKAVLPREKPLAKAAGLGLGGSCCVAVADTSAGRGDGERNRSDSMDSIKVEPIGPPEIVKPNEIYKLYRGTVGEIDNDRKRVWVEFTPDLQLCWAGYDLPATQYDQLGRRTRVSLLDLTSCVCETFDHRPCSQPTSSKWTRVEIYADISPGTAPLGGDRQPSQSRTGHAQGSKGIGPPSIAQLMLSIIGPPGAHCSKGPCPGKPSRNENDGSWEVPCRSETGSQCRLGPLQEFGEALKQLLKIREIEGQRALQRNLEFIQNRLFQYLWKRQIEARSEEEQHAAQAVLAFNLEPKEGVAYLKSKLNIRSEQKIGEWLALMATQKGGLDATLLGAYFSRRDTLETFRAFVRCLDFEHIDIVAALRKLFDTFKPGGEGQVITRILDYFAEAYFDQWRNSHAADMHAAGPTEAQKDALQGAKEALDLKDASVAPRVAYINPDSVCQVAVSLIMLNTGLHVATKKIGKHAGGAAMTVEQYISNTRGAVSEAEVSEEALRMWYEDVKDEEISVEPMPRAAFTDLPVQPDIEGWLIAVIDSRTEHRFWAVLALRRMYLFSDEKSEVEPGDAIDLKDVIVTSVAEDSSAADRFERHLQRRRKGGFICQCFNSRDRPGIGDIEDPKKKAFEVTQQASGKAVILQKLSPKPKRHITFVAESSDLMEKWVNLIAAGPY